MRVGKVLSGLCSKECFLVLFMVSEMGIIATSYFVHHKNDGIIEEM
jgi:hypothetical protein